MDNLSGSFCFDEMIIFYSEEQLTDLVVTNIVTI